jgi:hypothetical protein
LDSLSAPAAPTQPSQQRASVIRLEAPEARAKRLAEERVKKAAVEEAQKAAEEKRCQEDSSSVVGLDKRWFDSSESGLGDWDTADNSSTAPASEA